MTEPNGRVALVTGAGQGIGRDIAITLSASCRAVVVNDLHLDRAQATVELIRGAGGSAVPIAFDVSDHEAVTSAIAELTADNLKINILVNNAGLPPGADVRPFIDQTPGDWLPWINVNILGTMQVTHAVLGHMLADKWGRIVTIISEAGRVGLAGFAAYGAAKAGAAGLTRCLALESASRGVTANCVSLGVIKHDAAEGLITEEAEQKLVRAYPIRRLGTAADVSGMVDYLCSDAASWITGQTFPVNGGSAFNL